MSSDDPSEAPDAPAKAPPLEPPEAAADEAPTARASRPLGTTLPSATDADTAREPEPVRQGPGNTLVMEEGPSDFIQGAKRTLVSEDGPSEPERPPDVRVEHVRLVPEIGSGDGSVERPIEVSASKPKDQARVQGPGRAQAAPSANGPTKRGRWKRILKIALLAVLAVLLAGVLGVVLMVRHYESDLPSVAKLKKGYAPPQVTRILASDGSSLANVFTQRRTVVKVSSIPGHVKLAFLAAEDAHFYEHEGLNYFGMLRALFANLRAGKTVQGGSTITQQVVKNLLLDSARTYRRKARETILARRLEQHLTKDEIFGLYLNHIYLGHGRYGVEEASRYFFGKKTKELTVAEAALLAGLVASPERYSPRRAPKKALARRRYVIGQMLKKGFVTQKLHDSVVDAPLRIAPASDGESKLAPEVVSHVKKQLKILVGERAIIGGFTVHTTIDPAFQAAARKAVRAGLDGYAKRQKLAPPYTLKQRKVWGKPFEGTPRRHGIYVGRVVGTDDATGTIRVRIGSVTGAVHLTQEERYNPKHVKPSDFVGPEASLRVRLVGDPSTENPALRLELGPQAALVAIDPRSRHIKALIGSYEALSGGLNRALQAKRQPGSAFKPFVYGYALHSRLLTPATVLQVPAKGGGTEPLRLRMSIATSNNSGAQQVLKKVGPANVVRWAQSCGIESPMKPDISLALGAYEVTPRELANAYATYASGGEYATPVLITKIVGPDGKEVRLPEVPPKRRVMEPAEAYLITSIMSSVVTDGTAKRAKALGRPVAGKTGTTNKAKDAWFSGFTSELVATVWVGYDDAHPLGWGEQGAVTALPTWVDFMRSAHKGRPVTQFARPAGIVTAKIDPVTGLLPYDGQGDAIEEQFLEGTLPSTHAEVPAPDAGVDAGSDDAGADDDAGPAAPAPDAGAAPPASAVPSAAPPQPIPSNEPPPF